MFVQIIRGTTTEPEALRAHFDRWTDELGPTAAGWLDTTAGVGDDGQFIAVVRFESAEAARANSDREEQGRWWSEVTDNLSDPTFSDTTDVRELLGGPNQGALFVQVMSGRVGDRAAAERLTAEMDTLSDRRPDVIGMLATFHDDDRFTTVVYFTDEDSARAGEAESAPDQDEELGRDFEAAFTNIAYLDLRDPWHMRP